MRFKMKSLRNALHCTLLGFLLLALPFHTGAEPLITLLVGSQNAPKMFVGERGEATGYFTELASAITQRAGIKVNMVAVPWARALQLAEQGGGLIASLSRTPEREAIFNYSDPVIEDEIVIVTMKSKGLLASSLADLKGLKVGLGRGSRYGPRFVAELPLVMSEEDDNTEQRLRKLKAGRIDAAILYGGLPSVVFNARLANVDMSELVIQPKPLALDKNYLAIAKSRPDGPALLKRLNIAIAAMKADGTINGIMRRWRSPLR